MVPELYEERIQHPRDRPQKNYASDVSLLNLVWEFPVIELCLKACVPFLGASESTNPLSFSRAEMMNYASKACQNTINRFNGLKYFLFFFSQEFKLCLCTEKVP